MSLDFQIQDSGSFNITHNLNKMASEAGIYYPLWRPEEIGIKKAKYLIPLLEEGLEKLKKRPAYYKKFNAGNGWGKYENFVPFVEEVLQTCKNNPNKNVSVWR